MNPIHLGSTDYQSLVLLRTLPLNPSRPDPLKIQFPIGNFCDYVKACIRPQVNA